MPHEIRPVPQSTPGVQRTVATHTPTNTRPRQPHLPGQPSRMHPPRHHRRPHHTNQLGRRMVRPCKPARIMLPLQHRPIPHGQTRQSASQSSSTKQTNTRRHQRNTNPPVVTTQQLHCTTHHMNAYTHHRFFNNRTPKTPANFVIFYSEFLNGVR